MFEFLKSRSLKKTIAEALSDGVLTQAEVSLIFEMGKAAGIDPTDELIVQMKPIMQKVLESVMARVASTREFSPEDEAELDQMHRDLHLGAPTDLPAFKPYRILWQVNHGEPPDIEPIDVPIILGKGEKCYFATGATWGQLKTVTTSQGYVGGAVRFRVARGISFSLGRSVPVSTKSTQLVPIDQGTLYLTNRRTLFVGGMKSNETKFTAVVQVEPYSDGIAITKSRGTPDLYVLSGVGDSAIAEAIIRMFAGS